MLGIDLGTTNSVVAVADGVKARVLSAAPESFLVPSVVAFLPDGGLRVGETAREQRLVDARNTIYSVKRLIGRPFASPEVRRAQERFAFELVPRPGGGVGVRVRDSEVYTLTEISAFVLREIKHVAESILGEACDQAVITVPANFNELQRSATQAAGKVAGLDVLRIINEPTAAALAYGYRGETRRVAVYDLGGGTFDITILELEDEVFEVISTAGDTFLGGDDFDAAVVEVMADQFAAATGLDPRRERQALERLRAAAEWVKCNLSYESDVGVRIEELMDGADFEFAMTRPELEGVITDLIDTSFEVCKVALKEAHVGVEDVDRVVLVGGSTRTPLVRKRVAQFFGREPETGIDPDLVVAQGAAIQGFRLSGRKPVPPPVPAAVVAPVKAVGEPEGVDLPVPASVDLSLGLGGDEGLPAVLGSDEDLPAVLGGEEDLPAVLGDLPTPAEEPVDDFALGELEGFPGADVDGASIELDPEYEALAESMNPGAIRRYNDLGAGEVAVELELPDVHVDASERPSDFTLLHATVPKAPRVPREVALPVLKLDSAPAPLLMDVTPQSLGVEMAGGHCLHLIPRNAPIPAEQSRTFTTAKDNQREVAVRVCQGEARVFDENQVLGEVLLEELREAPRGHVKIEVAFILDANGTLDVKATDVETGRAQAIRINLRGGLSEEELTEMRIRQEGLLGEAGA